MHISTSDLLPQAKKSPLINISARATITPKCANQQHNNLQYTIPKYLKQRYSNNTHASYTVPNANAPLANHVGNSKNIQSFSTSALPCIDTLQLANNCQSSNAPIKIQDTQMNTIHSTQSQLPRTVSKQKKQSYTFQQKNKKKEKKQVKYLFNLSSHHKSSTQITIKNFRQTVQPNTYLNNATATTNLPKHKQPDWINKIESYTRLFKSPKSILQEEKTGIQMSKHEQQKDFIVSHRYTTNTHFKEQNHRSSSKNKLMFRQTLDPQMQRTFWETKPNQTIVNEVRKKSPNKERLQLKIQKPIKVQTKAITNKNHYLSQPSIFWKNKAISPPSKSFSPETIHQMQKQQNGQIVPPLPLKNQEKIYIHRPSFFNHKKSLSRFSIMKKLGTGTYSDSYLCMEKKIGALFCLKMYHKATIRNFSQILQIFIKKISFQLLAQHPNIVQLYDVFSEGQYIYTIQQYMQGGRLCDQIQNQIQQRQKQRRFSGKLQANPKDGQQLLINEAKIIDRIFDINSALCYIHQSCDTVVKTNKKRLPPLVHAEVRTKSILINMGVCKLPTIQPIHSQPIVINSYSPPELIIQQVFIPKSDIWNLGLVLFQLCAQRKLFGHSQGNKNQVQQSNKLGYQVFNVNIGISKVNITEQIQKLQNTTHLLKQLMKKLLMIQPQLRPSSDVVMSSNVFKMYGFDTEWKQRRHEQATHDKGNLPNSYKTPGRYIKLSEFEDCDNGLNQNNSRLSNNSNNHNHNSQTNIKTEVQTPKKNQQVFNFNLNSKKPQTQTLNSLNNSLPQIHFPQNGNPNTSNRLYIKKNFNLGNSKNQ